MDNINTAIKRKSKVSKPIIVYKGPYKKLQKRVLNSKSERLYVNFYGHIEDKETYQRGSGFDTLMAEIFYDESWRIKPKKTKVPIGAMDLSSGNRWNLRCLKENKLVGTNLYYNGNMIGLGGQSIKSDSLEFDWNSHTRNSIITVDAICDTGINNCVLGFRGGGRQFIVISDLSEVKRYAENYFIDSQLEDMPFDDYQKILNDKKHPLYGFLKKYNEKETHSAFIRQNKHGYLEKITSILELADFLDVQYKKIALDDFLK